MTRFLLLTAIAAFTYLNCHAQDYNETLKKTFTAFDTTQDFTKKVEQSNKLTMIAKKWNNEWTAHFYNAYAKAVLSYMEKDEAKRDAYVDEADKELSEAVGILGKDNDETYVLAAMVANARMAVKPQARWQKYGKIFEENLQKAKEINAENPRIYYLQGTNKFFTPKMFGGGKKAALPYFEKADGYFAKETDADMSKPYWGKFQNAFFLKESKGEDKE
jgi:GNAT superfamily N-acetyltransferase